VFPGVAKHWRDSGANFYLVNNPQALKLKLKLKLTLKEGLCLIS
jgi:hypothetical protein